MKQLFYNNIMVFKEEAIDFIPFFFGIDARGGILVSPCAL